MGIEDYTKETYDAKLKTLESAESGRMKTELEEWVTTNSECYKAGYKYWITAVKSATPEQLESDIFVTFQDDWAVYQKSMKNEYRRRVDAISDLDKTYFEEVKKKEHCFDDALYEREDKLSGLGFQMRLAPPRER